MVWRKAFLLVLGIAGSFLATAVLYISAENAQTVQKPSVLPELQVPTFCDVALPTGVPGTALIAHRLSAYDGPFLEDSSDREEFGIAALLIYNGGSKMLLTARVELGYPDGVYIFSGTHIPPNSWVMLLEQKGSAYRKDPPVSCTGEQAVMFDEAELPVLVEDTATGMQICNRGEAPLKDVIVYYKTWLESPGFYVGGITYRMEIHQLAPGETLELQPYHYAPEHSKVVSISGRK